MSLKDQLLKAGLVTEKQAREAGHKHKQVDKKAGHKARQAAKEAAAAEARAQAEKQKAADQALEARKAEERLAANAQLSEKQRHRSAIEAAYHEGKVDKWEGPRRYHYACEGRIEILMVNDDAGRKLEGGHLAIVQGEKRPHRHVLLLAGAARKLREAAPERVLVWHGN